MGQGEVPTMKLRSWDDTTVFTLMGGEAIPDYYNNPETIHVKDIKGLVPPWKQIDQKGATQDGRSFITSLYDPCEVELTVRAKGRSPRKIRRTVNDLIASIDAIQTSELSWFTQELGRWWAPVRWMDSYKDPEGGMRTLRQILSLRLRAYDAFWRSYDVVDLFRIGHTDAPGDFTTDADALDPTEWDVVCTGGGSLSVADGQVVSAIESGQSAVARRLGWSNTSPDATVIELQLGSLSEWFFDQNTAFDFWLLPAHGAGGLGPIGQDGYRIRVSAKTVNVDRFVAGTATHMDTQPIRIPPRSAEKWTFVAGPKFQLFRSGALAYSFTPASIAEYPTAGFGVFSSNQTNAPGIRAISFGTDAVASQSGYVRFVNWGDQPMPPRFTCVGPGTFSFADGPNATDFVQFGPLLAGQTAQILSDARKRGVTDLSFGASDSAQDTGIFTQGVNDWLSFVNLVGGLLNEWFAWAGQSSTPAAPQGNLYSLMKGRFSKQVYIPPKPVGTAPQGYHISVKIEGGNANSQIISAGTPLRRLPY